MRPGEEPEGARDGTRELREALLQKQAGLDLDDVSTARGVHAKGRDAPVALEGELDLVSVPERAAWGLATCDERLRDLRGKVADPGEGIDHVGALGCQLSLAGERHPGAAAAGARIGAGGRNAVRASLEHLCDTSSREARAVGGHLRKNAVARCGPSHEDGLSVLRVGNGVGAVGHPLDSELERAVACVSRHASPLPPEGVTPLN